MDKDYCIERAHRNFKNEFLSLAKELWPDSDHLNEELSPLLDAKDAAVFLAFYANQAIAFAQCQLRYDYVEGTASSPVGYLEGIYVKDEFRVLGIGRSLVQACMQWAKEQNCREFASDCQWDNQISQIFHEKIGFTKVNQIVCYVKRL